MLIIPAIDIKEGSVVRLFQGKFSESKVYSNDPLKTAKHWIRQGADVIHIVDLDGAATGTPKNIDAVKGITKESGAKLQFGGGVRSLDTIKMLLDAGVWRVVLGTKAAEDDDFLVTAFKRFSNRIIVSIDAKDGKVLVQGWKEESVGNIEAVDLAQQLKSIGFKELIYTNVSKDGTLKGPDIKGIKDLLKKTGMQIIASGGISNLNDLSRLKELEKQGVSGVIIGKALYEGKFTLREALAYS